MLRAYGYWSEDEREIVGISFWGFQGVVRSVAGL
jgi:hypothetical protein